MSKKYICKFESKYFINEEDLLYKNSCNFNNRMNNEPYKKFYDKHLFRYSLSCKIKDVGKSITVILMNPSYADEYGLDSTLCNVREFLIKNTDYSAFEVLNIFPIRTPNSKDVSNLMQKYQKIQTKNNDYVKSILTKSQDILVAWGGKYHNKTMWILDLLKNKNVYAYDINKDGSPRHFAPQAYNRAKKSLQKYEI